MPYFQHGQVTYCFYFQSCVLESNFKVLISDIDKDSKKMGEEWCQGRQRMTLLEYCLGLDKGHAASSKAEMSCRSKLMKKPLE